MSTNPVLQAKKILEEHYPRIRADIVAFRERGIEHKAIQKALNLPRNAYWYHLHAAERETGKHLS